jgi:hypothetical protein
VDLYGNEREEVSSAYRLDGGTNETILQNLSGINNLRVRYHKDEFSQKQQRHDLGLTQIFIRELQPLLIGV